MMIHRAFLDNSLNIVISPKTKLVGAIFLKFFPLAILEPSSNAVSIACKLEQIFKLIHWVMTQMNECVWQPLPTTYLLTYSTGDFSTSIPP